MSAAAPTLRRMEPAGADYPVRPTRLCLDHLGCGTGADLPDLGTPLSGLDHPLVERAQRLPEELAAGAAQRIKCIEDRAWFKVRYTERWRGAGTRLSDAEHSAGLGIKPGEPPGQPGRWWLGAGGWREAGSPDDFYTELERRAEKEAEGDHKHDATSRWLMPVEWDWKRLHAESAVRAHGGEGAFLAITADGIYDPKVIAVMLSAVPGVPAHDWLAEPDGAAGIQPRPGQIIWSTLLTPQQTADLLVLDDAELV